MSFYRPTSNPELFQVVSIDASGKRDEAVAAHAGITLVRYIFRKGLIDQCVVLDVAEDQERAWTIIETEQEARRWEGQFAQIVPLRAAEYAEQHGPDLLQRTKKVRAWASICIGLIPGDIECSDYFRRESKIVSPHTTRRATELSDLNCAFYEYEYAYLVSAITLLQQPVTFVDQHELNRSPRDFDVLTKKETRLVLHLTADLLLARSRIAGSGEFPVPCWPHTDA